MSPLKLLAIKFKYLGDVTLAIPALRALRETFPDAEIHYLVYQEALPLIQNFPWINHKWGINRNIKDAIKLIYKLNRYQFDFSVDFVGNDRGALTSKFINADLRLGPKVPLGFIGREHCYTHLIPEEKTSLHESLRDLHILSRFNIPPPSSTQPELHADPSLIPYAQKTLPSNPILCHLSTSRQKKEWPLDNWISFFKLNHHLQNQIVFTTGPSQREKDLLKNLSEQIPQARFIQEIPNLSHFMALVKQARVIICNDSLPAHLAAGLGTPCIVFFGPTTVSQWHPNGKKTIVLKASDCQCWGHPKSCHALKHCLSNIKPEVVSNTLKELLLQL